MPLAEDCKIQHIGIVADDLEEALALLGLSRSDVSEEVLDTNQQNLLAFVHLPANDLWLEFVIPQATNSTTWRFAKKHGLGLHHLGFEAESLDGAARRIGQRTGVFELGRYAINVNSFGGSIRTLFYAARGLIIEFVERVEKK